MLDMEGDGQIAMISMQSGANAIQAYRVAQDGSMAVMDPKQTGLMAEGEGHRLRGGRL